MGTKKQTIGEGGKPNSFAELAKKEAEKNKSQVKTPIQSKKPSGIVKPKMYKFNFNMRSDHLKSLKLLALEKETTVTQLLIDAYTEKYEIK